MTLVISGAAPNLPGFRSRTVLSKAIFYQTATILILLAAFIYEHVLPVDSPIKTSRAFDMFGDRAAPLAQLVTHFAKRTS